MLSSRITRASSWLNHTANRTRSFSATPAHSLSSLVFIEHRDGKINSATLSALNAAQQIDKNQIVGLITGSSKTLGFQQAVELSAKFVLLSPPSLSVSLTLKWISDFLFYI
jgi:hypothetical protein